MAIRTRDELLTSIRSRFEDDTCDECISLIEDVTDTLSDLETRSSDNTDWRARYEENDASWRQRYRDRFFGGHDDPDPEPDPVPSKPKTFEELFT